MQNLVKYNLRFFAYVLYKDIFIYKTAKEKPQQGLLAWHLFDAYNWVLSLSNRGRYYATQTESNFVLFATAACKSLQRLCSNSFLWSLT